MMEKMTKFRKLMKKDWKHAGWVKKQDGLKSRILQSLVEQWYRGTVKVPTEGRALANHTGSTFKIDPESDHFLQFYHHELCLGFLQKFSSPLPLVYYSLSQGLVHYTQEGFTRSITRFVSYAET